jgi:hypothetical protein
MWMDDRIGTVSEEIKEISRTEENCVNVMTIPVKWSRFLWQVFALFEMHQVSVHAAFRVSALPKYALSGVRLSRAV